MNDRHMPEMTDEEIYHAELDAEQASMGMDRQMYEDDLLVRIRSGRTTDDDAKYVAWALGRTLPKQRIDKTESKLTF